MGYRGNKASMGRSLFYVNNDSNLLFVDYVKLIQFINIFFSIHADVCIFVSINMLTMYLSCNFAGDAPLKVLAYCQPLSMVTDMDQ